MTYLEKKSIVLCLVGCPGKGLSDVPQVTNGHRAKSYKLSYRNGFVSGWYAIECDSGYAFDPPSDGKVTCLPSGSWSSLPQCNKSPGTQKIHEICRYN